MIKVFLGGTCNESTWRDELIRHNLKTGRNMGEMNVLAIQFINGGI